MDCDFKIELNEAMIAKIEQAQKDALKQTGHTLLTDIVQKQVMPFESGEMQNNRTFVETPSEQEVVIRTSAPQARRLYFHPEYNFQQGKNKNAGGRWFDRYLPGGTDEKLPAQHFAFNLRRRLGL
ncbi:MAG: hypothetical protein IK142_02600 [Clostridiales bacterium]|nr:hypothetical protein [Clostridiales bacterium]